MKRTGRWVDACSVPGCSGVVESKFLCKKHYCRVWSGRPINQGDFRQRFESKLRVTPGCWIWLGAKFKSGYGRIQRDGKRLRANRVSFELYCAPIPDGLHVLHTCDNPICVNPDHLFIGTHLDNMRDMESKGRARWIQGNLKAKRNEQLHP